MSCSIFLSARHRLSSFELPPRLSIPLTKLHQKIHAVALTALKLIATTYNAIRNCFSSQPTSHKNEKLSHREADQHDLPPIEQQPHPWLSFNPEISAQDTFKSQQVIESIKNNLKSDRSHPSVQFASKVLKKKDPELSSLSQELENNQLNGPLTQKLLSKVTRCRLFLEQSQKPLTEVNWVSGSSSASLIGIDDVSTSRLTNQKHALVPTGMLLENGVTPLTGELEWGIASNGVNQRCLSGVPPNFAAKAVGYALLNNASPNGKSRLEQSLEASINFIKNFDYNNNKNLTKLRLHVLRYLKLRPQNDRNFSNLKNHVAKIAKNISQVDVADDWQRIEGRSILGTYLPSKIQSKTNPSVNVGSVVGIPRSGGGHTWGVVVETATVDRGYGPEVLATCLLNKEGIKKTGTAYSLIVPEDDCFPSSENFDPNDHYLEERVTSQTGYAQIQQILQSFDQVGPYQLTVEEQQYINAPFPIVWGAHVAQERFQEVRSDIQGEKAVTGVLELGNEEGVRWAFTKKKELQRLHNWLVPRELNVTTASMTFLFYLAMQKNPRNGSF